MATFNENFNSYAERRKKKNVVDFFLGDQKEAIEQEILTERYTPNADKNKDISNFLTREDPAEEQARINRLKEISENAKREMEAIGNKGQSQAPISLPKENANLKKTQIFGKESFEDFSKQQDEYMAKYNKEPLGKVAKTFGYIMDTPNRIPGVNQIMDTAGKTFLGDENYKKHYTPGEYEKSTGNKLLDTGAKFAGNIGGLAMNPGQTLGLNSMLNVTDDLSRVAANKLTGNMADNVGTRILNSTARGVVDGASGDFINSTRLGKSNEEILQDTLMGAVGGGAMFGGGKLLGEGRKALSNLSIPKVELSETPDVKLPQNNLKLYNNSPDNLRMRSLEPPKVDNQLVGPLKTEAITEPITDLKTADLNTPIKEDLLRPRVNNIKQLDDKLKIKPKNSLVEPTKIDSNNLLPTKIESDIEPINAIKNDIVNTTQQIPKAITEITPKIETPKVTTRMIPKALRETTEAPKIDIPATPKVEETKKSFNEKYIESEIQNLTDNKERSIGILGEERYNKDLKQKEKLLVKEQKKNQATKIEAPIKAEAQTVDTGIKEPTLNVKVEEKKVKPSEETAFTSQEAPIKGKTKISKLKTNTWQNTEYLKSDEAKKVVDDISAEYNVKANENTLNNSVEELNRNHRGVVNRISTYGLNTAEDTASAGLITKDLADKGEYENLKYWLNGVRSEVTNNAQSLQALRIWKDGSKQGTLLKASRVINSAKEEVLKGNPKLKETIEAETKQIIDSMDKIDNEKVGELVEEIEVNTGTKTPKKPNIPKAPGVKETKAETKQEQFELEGGSKEPTWEEINDGLAEILAKKVDNASKPPIVKAMDMEKELIDNLFKISKEQLPKYEKTPVDKYELVKLALRNKEQYNDVFEKSKEILIEKYGLGSSEINLLQSWIDKKARPIFYTKNMDKVISDKLKEHGIKMTELVKKHYSANNNVRKDLIEELTGQGNLSSEDSKIISDYINKRMDELTKEAKEKVLNNMAKPKNTKPRVEKSTMERILELNNLGAWDNAAIKDIISEKYGLPNLTTENVKFISEAMDKIEKMDEGEAKEIAFGKVKRYIADQVPATFKDKAKGMQMINLLLNTKTMLRNIKGNILTTGLETVKDIPGALIDKGVSKFTGETSTYLPTMETIKTKVGEGFKETKRAIVDVKEGIDRSPTTGQYDLPITKAFKKIDNPKGIKQRFNNLYSTGEDLTKLGLSVGDRFFYKGAYEESIRMQKLHNPNKSLEAMQKEATNTAEHSTFQNKSLVYQAMNGVKNGLNKFGVNDFGIGDIIFPFLKTPANIIDKAIEYSPLGGIKGIVNLAFNMKKGKISQKEVVDQLARATTGSALMGVGVLLSSQGLLTGKQDKNSNVANFKKQAGITPYSVKIGNEYHTMDWLQPVAVPLMIGADVYQSLVKEKGNDITGSILEAVKTGTSTVFNQSLLQGIAKLFGGYSQNSGENLLDGIFEVLSQAPGQFVPFNSLTKQVTQLTDKTYRDSKSDNPIKQEANKIIAKIPGLSKTLPAKVDLLGREQTTYDETGLIGNLNNVLNRGGFKNTYNPTKAEKVILEAYEKTKNTDLIPKKAPTEITVDKVPNNLSIAEQRRYQTTMGTEIQKNLSYKNSYSEEDIEEVIKEAKKKAKEEFLKYKK